MFSHLPPTPDMKILNLSTLNACMWSFPWSGDIIPEVDCSFARHVRREVSRLGTNIDRTIILESSLQPLLQSFKPEERKEFLEKNLINLAQGYLKLASEVQELCKYTAICTSLHTAYSPYYAEEAFFINQFNEIIKLGALHLQMGLIDMASSGIHTLISDNKKINYRINPYITNPICDYAGRLSIYGQNCVLNQIRELEAEKILIRSQAEETRASETSDDGYP